MSPSATPQSDTSALGPPESAGTPHVFEASSAVLNLLQPAQSADFAEQVLGVSELLIQTKPQGAEHQYLHRPYRTRDGLTGTYPVYTLTLPGQRRVMGRMTITRSVATKELRQGHILTQRINLAQGAVYYALNPLQPGKPRRDENVMGIRALALDLDGTPLPDSWPLPPTAIVETSPGRYQVLWRTAGIEVKQYKLVQQYLADHHGGDRAVCNPSLSLRLPGSLNGKKGMETPHPVSLFRVQPGQYTKQDVLDAYPALAARLTSLPTHSPGSRLQGAVGQDRRQRYGTTVLHAEVKKVIAAPVGERNAQLFRSAAAVGGLIAPALLDEELARTALREAAQAAGLEASEVEATLASGLKRGKGTPRDLGYLAGERP